MFDAPEDSANILASPDAERALLGAILLNNPAYDKVSDFLLAEHFADPLNGNIYQAAGELICQGGTVDALTLRGKFEGAGDLEDQGAAVLADLVTEAVSILNAAEYGRIIHDLAIRRSLRSAALSIAADANQTGEDLQAIINRASERIFTSTASSMNCGGLTPVKDAAEAALAAATAAYESGTGIIGIPTGLRALDNTLGGLSPGNLVILGGRPGMGKTALALQVVAQAPGRKLFFSLEMTAAELGTRLLSMRSGVGGSDITRGKFSAADFRQIQAAKPKDDALFIDERSRTIEAIQAQCRRARVRGQVSLIVIDHIGLIAAADRRQNRVQQLTEITAALKALAKDMECPILALTQLNRAVENRDDKRPTLADLRDSGSIEQDADAVLLLYRAEYYRLQEREDISDAASVVDWQKNYAADKNAAEINIAKNRHGPTTRERLRCEIKTSTFFDPARDGEQPTVGLFE